TRTRLVEALLTSAQADVTGGRIPRGLGRLNQLLALAPEDPRVAELGRRLRAGERRQRRWRQIRRGALAMGAVLAAVLLGRTVVARLPPAGTRPTQILTSTAAPSAAVTV